MRFILIPPQTIAKRFGVVLIVRLTFGPVYIHIIVAVYIKAMGVTVHTPALVGSVGEAASYRTTLAMVRRKELSRRLAEQPARQRWKEEVFMPLHPALKNKGA